MAAPTNVRVEATGDGQTMLRWSYSGASSLGVYRSTNGSAYSLVTTLASSVREYNDTGLAERTRYWYKLSDDVGSTFSSVVTVWTHVHRNRKHGNSNQTKFRSRQVSSAITPQDYNELAQSLESELASKARLSEPCDLCLSDGALVIDCTQGCEWFRVVVDEDINSISLLGCDDCPPVDFIIPPNVDRGICGWPVGCDFFGDECFQAKVPGGTNGRTAKTNGVSYDGYGPSPQRTSRASCPCPPNSTLSIKCCSANCNMACGQQTSVTLKACGGLGPYTWSKTGEAVLSATTGRSVIVTRRGTAGVLPAQVASVGIRTKAWLATTLGCAGFDDVISPCSINDSNGPGYNCDGTQITSSASWPMTSAGTGPGLGRLQHPGNCGNVAIDISDSIDTGSVMELNPANAGAGNPKISNGGSVTVTISHTNPNTGIAFSEAKVFTPPITNGTTVAYNGKFDVRTAAMIAAGCPEPTCTSTPITVTVTDSVGVSVTTILT